MLSKTDLEEMAHIRAGLEATRGKLGGLMFNTPEYNKLFAYRMGLHMRIAEIMGRQPVPVNKRGILETTTTPKGRNKRQRRNDKPKNKNRHGKNNDAAPNLQRGGG